MFASIRTTITKLFRNEDGATAIEYGMIAALISVVVVPALVIIGPKLANSFTTISDAIK